MKTAWITHLFLILLLVSCATGGRKERSSYLKLVKLKSFSKAHDFLKSSSFFQNKDNHLLFLYEQGMLFHIEGKHYQSTKILEKAKELAQKQYTKKISKKLKSAVTNENYDIFYGETFERSLLHFYLSLNHVLLSQKDKYWIPSEDPKKKEGELKELSPKMKRRELQAARAELLAWDSYLKTLNHDNRGNSVFKNDLLAKIYGGYIHEMIGSGADRQTALQLYKNAFDILMKRYNAYKTFNSSSVAFKKNFKKLHTMKSSEVEKKFVVKTEWQKKIRDFLTFKVLSLTKNLRPNFFKREVKALGADKDILSRVKKVKSDSNVQLVIQKGFIPKKVPHKSYYSLDAAFGKNKGVARVGSLVLGVFAAKTLGLLPPPGSYDPVGTRIGVEVGAAATRFASISFELPKISSFNYDQMVEVEFFDEKGKSVLVKEVELVNPMGDIAQEAIAEKSSWLYKKLGMRLATKHVTAIATAYGIYLGIKEKSEFFAKNAAVLSYLGFSKGIAASEKADTRSWSILPSDIRITHLNLPKGKYSLKSYVYALKDGKRNKIKEYDFGTLEIKNKKSKIVRNLRLI